jgi:hypothetical protein
MFFLPDARTDPRPDPERKAQFDGALAWCAEHVGPRAPANLPQGEPFLWSFSGFYARDPYGNEDPLLSGIYFGSIEAGEAFRIAMGIPEALDDGPAAAIRAFGEGTDLLSIEAGDGMPTPNLVMAVLVHASEGKTKAGWARRKGERRVVDGIGTLRIGGWLVSVVMDSGRLDHVHAAVSPTGHEARHDVVGNTLSLMTRPEVERLGAWIRRLGPLG